MVSGIEQKLRPIIKRNNNTSLTSTKAESKETFNEIMNKAQFIKHKIIVDQVDME